MKRNKSVKTANQFYLEYTGSETTTPYMLGYSLSYGVTKVAEETQSFWFLDVIVSYAFDEKRRMRNVSWQKWVLKRIDDSDAFVVEGKDDDNNVVITQNIPYSDFPFDEYELYVRNNVILLPSEN